MMKQLLDRARHCALAATLVGASLVAVTQPLYAQDKHVGYYHPEITSEEVFDRVVRDGPEAGKAVRIEFVTSLTKAQLAAPAAPGYALIAKGDDAKHLIIVAQNGDSFKTLYRARGAMAHLTANLRSGGFFRQQDLQYVATFFDFLQILQFDTLVLTDGETWSHKVTFERN